MTSCSKTCGDVDNKDRSNVVPKHVGMLLILCYCLSTEWNNFILNIRKTTWYLLLTFNYQVELCNGDSVFSVSYNCVCVQITFRSRNLIIFMVIELKYFVQVKLLKPTGHVMHQQFNIQQLYALPHTVFICFVFIWEQTATCATYSINWLVFITQMKSVYCAVRTGVLNKAVCASSL